MELEERGVCNGEGVAAPEPWVLHYPLEGRDEGGQLVAVGGHGGGGRGRHDTRRLQHADAHALRNAQQRVDGVLLGGRDGDAGAEGGEGTTEHRGLHRSMGGKA